MAIVVGRTVATSYRQTKVEQHPDSPILRRRPNGAASLWSRPLTAFAGHPQTTSADDCGHPQTTAAGHPLTTAAAIRRPRWFQHLYTLSYLDFATQFAFGKHLFQQHQHVVKDGRWWRN